MADIKFKGKFYVEGSAKGKLVKSDRPISFWGGLDPVAGKIIDKRSDIYGRTISDRILAFPEGIGSSTTSAVLLESVLNETNPLALINVTTEPILVSGALVAKEFYGTEIPVVSLGAADYEQLTDGAELVVDGERKTVTLIND